MSAGTSFQEVSITTYDAIGVPLIQAWKEACEAGNHLIVWNEEEGAIIVREESEEIAPIMLVRTSSPFGTVVYLSLKARQDSKDRLQIGRSGTRDGDDQQAWMEIWEMYSDKARESMNGSAAES
jgi:hypothetical protein